MSAIQGTDFAGVSGRISFINGDRSGITELSQCNYFVEGEEFPYDVRNLIINLVYFLADYCIYGTCKLFIYAKGFG